MVSDFIDDEPNNTKQGDYDWGPERHLSLSYVNFRRDSELGQMLMTCGKLSNQAPSVKSRINETWYSYDQ